MKKTVKKAKSLDSKIDSLTNTVDTLAMAVAKGFDRVGKDITELKESNKGIRKDILNLGDRFVSYHAFDALARRVKHLEEKD